MQTDSLCFDSYIIQEADLRPGELRLLTVDKPLFLPVATEIRFLITSLDVIHSWAVPALGIKTDACAGRLNSTSTYILRRGIFYGQCSEICGVYHGFMPIVIEAINYKDFVDRL